MEPWTLEVVSIPGKHDGEAIARVLARIFVKWSLDIEKCVRFVRDGASNMKSACNKLKLARMSCAAHSLHLVVAAALMQKSGDKLDESIPGGSGAATTTGGDDRIGDDFELVGDTLDSIAFDSMAEISWLNVQITDHEVTIDSTVGERLVTEDDSDDEYICEAEVAALCEQVVQFVETAARSAFQEVNTADLESVRMAVRQFRKKKFG
ncbi:hypothetical protein DVH05_003939 [Phytophthora capsici]|nr:hypothetical protein DVH05_003939 [Phytophthora capsici]